MFHQPGCARATSLNYALLTAVYSIGHRAIAVNEGFYISTTTATTKNAVLFPLFRFSSV